jgi:hypothetical protein
VHQDASGSKVLYFFRDRNDFEATGSWQKRDKTAAELRRALGIRGDAPT